jgi:hypothetical protein
MKAVTDPRLSTFVARYHKNTAKCVKADCIAGGQGQCAVDSQFLRELGYCSRS